MSLSTQFMDEYELWRGDMAMMCAIEYDWVRELKGYDPEDGFPLEDYHLEVLKVEVYAWWEVGKDGQEVAGWDTERDPVALIPPLTEEERQAFETHVMEMSCPDE